MVKGESAPKKTEKDERDIVEAPLWRIGIVGDPTIICDAMKVIFAIVFPNRVYVS